MLLNVPEWALQGANRAYSAVKRGAQRTAEV
jgi:hypothetical protein